MPVHEFVANVLTEGSVFIGFHTCPPPAWRRIAVARSLDEAQHLVYDPLCAASPVKTALVLARRGIQKIGMFLRACEGRSLVELLKARQLERGALRLHAVACPGVIASGKLSSYLQRCGPGEVRGEGVVVIRDAGARFLVELSERGATLHPITAVVEIPKEEVVAERCFDCRAPVDLAVDSSEEGAFATPSFARPSVAPPTEAAPLEEWEKVVSQCILCMACRQACAGCFCRECVFEEKLRQEKTPALFHLVRMLHLAGRCTGCGQCKRVCPLGMSLLQIRARLEKWIETRYGTEGAGLKLDADPSLLQWRPSDL